MSFNACSINDFRINDFIGHNKFSILLPIFRPIVGANPHAKSSATAARTSHQPPPDLEQEPPLSFEQPIVTVTVELFGVSSSETQDVTSRLDFISVTDFSIAPLEEAISVNISEFDIK